MPGEVDLAEEFGCARATVNRAMRELADEGFIDRKRKAGTRIKSSPTRHAKFAIPLIRDEIENSGETYRYALIRRDTPKTPDWLRARLALSPQAGSTELGTVRQVLKASKVVRHKRIARIRAFQCRG